MNTEPTTEATACVADRTTPTRTEEYSGGWIATGAFVFGVFLFSESQGLGPLAEIGLGD